MAMADRFGLHGSVGEIRPVQSPPQAGADDRAERGGGLRGPERGVIVNRMQPARGEARDGFGTHAGNVAQREGGEPIGQLLAKNHHQAVGPLHVARHLGDQLVGCDADRGAELIADVRPDRRLDPPTERGGNFGRVLVIEQAARDLVDRTDGGDGDVPPHLGNDALVILDIKTVPRGGENQIGAERTRLAHLVAGADAVGFRLVGSGDDRSRQAFHRRDRDGPAAQMRLLVLLDRREIAVQIEIEPAEGATRGRHNVWKHIANRWSSAPLIRRTPRVGRYDHHPSRSLPEGPRAEWRVAG